MTLGFSEDDDLHRMIEVQDRARKMMDEHGLEDWTFEISATKQTLGSCNHSRKKIVFSQYFLHTDFEDTILHEIAHALIGPNHGHNWLWKHTAREIGANPERTSHEKPAAKPNYLLVCPECGQTWERFRLRKNRRYRCPHDLVELVVSSYKEATDEEIERSFDAYR